MVVSSTPITDTSTNLLESRIPDPSKEPSILKLDHLKGIFPLKCANIYSVDVILKKRVKEFQSLGRCSTALKVLAVALFFLVPVAYFIWKMARSFDQTKSDRLEEVRAQLSKDEGRKVLVTLNGFGYDHLQSFLDDLDQTGISDVQKYTVLQLAHQGVYATLLHACRDDLLTFANTFAPLSQEEDQPLNIDKKGDPAPYQLVRDITNGQEKSIRLKIEKGVSLLSTEIQLGVSVYDQNAPAPFRSRVIFEFDTNFTIDLKDGTMSIGHRLDRINPMTGPVPLYYGERESISSNASAPSSTENSLAERGADTPSPLICETSVST